MYKKSLNFASNGRRLPAQLQDCKTPSFFLLYFYFLQTVYQCCAFNMWHVRTTGLTDHPLRLILFYFLPWLSLNAPFSGRPFWVFYLLYITLFSLISATGGWAINLRMQAKKIQCRYSARAILTQGTGVP